MPKSKGKKRAIEYNDFQNAFKRFERAAKVKEYFLKTSKTVEVHSLGEAKWMNPIWENDM